MELVPLLDCFTLGNYLEMKISSLYKSSIAKWLNTDNSRIELYWKGRIGLYAILKSFGIEKGDEVILPAFTCVVVPNAIIYCKGTPVYVDINKVTLNTTIDKIKEKVSAKTKVIVIQNTFGLSSDVKEIVSFAKEKGILTIEDCTHGFGGEYEGKPNGSYCDAAFYSTQWNKPFSTGIGGFAVMNNRKYIDRFNLVNDKLISPSIKDRNVLALLIQAKKYLLHDSTYWSAIKLYRKLSKSGLVVGSSKGEELVSPEMPENYFLKSVRVQEKVGSKAIKELPDVLRRRKEMGLLYNEFFRTNEKWHYQKEDLANHSFLNFPVFVKDKAAFQKKAENAKIRLGDWFVSPIHPVLEDFDLWGLNINDCPNAIEKSNHILNLPTDLVGQDKVIQFLKVNLDDIL